MENKKVLYIRNAPQDLRIWLMKRSEETGLTMSQYILALLDKDRKETPKAVKKKKA